MTRLRAAGPLLGYFGWLVAGISAQARGEDFALRCVSDDGFLQIYSAQAVDPARCKSIVSRVVDAYEFVAQQAAWTDARPLRDKPLQFRLLAGSLKVLGYAEGANLMVMKDEYLDKPLSQGTLAHELTHIQDARQLRGRKLPSFMAEGRALTIGHSYRMSLGQAADGYDHRMAASALRFTAGDARTLLSEYRGNGWDNQAIGTFLVEYMRTKWNGAGVPDVNPRLSRMIEIMAKGADFEAAFKQEFGTSFAALRKSFARYLDDTRDDPRGRLQATMWQSVSPSDSPGRLED